MFARLIITVIIIVLAVGYVVVLSQCDHFPAGVCPYGCKNTCEEVCAPSPSGEEVCNSNCWEDSCQVPWYLD